MKQAACLVFAAAGRVPLAAPAQLEIGALNLRGRAISA
jgi:hypothetical protein